MSLLKPLVFTFLLITMARNPLLAAAPFQEAVQLTSLHKIKLVTFACLSSIPVKDVVVSDGESISIFKQAKNHSFKNPITFKAPVSLTGLTTCHTGKSNLDIVILFGEGKAFSLSLNADGQTPTTKLLYPIKTQDALLMPNAQQGNPSFTTDITNTGMDDIILPSSSNIIILKQVRPQTFRPEQLPILEPLTKRIDWNLNPWSKYPRTSLEAAKGVFFAPSTYQKNKVIIQDINNDSIKEILCAAETASRTIINVFSQRNTAEWARISQITLPTPDGPLNEIYFKDVNGDSLPDLIGIKVISPLNTTTSLLPLLEYSIFFMPQLKENLELTTADLTFKTAFIPGLSMIEDIDGDGTIEILTAPSPVNMNSKEAALSIVSRHEIAFQLGYSHWLPTKKKLSSFTELGKPIVLTLSNLSEINDLNHSVKLSDLYDNKIKEIITFSQDSQLHILTPQVSNNQIAITDSLDIKFPFLIKNFDFQDLNGDGNKELVATDLTERRLQILFNE